MSGLRAGKSNLPAPCCLWHRAAFHHASEPGERREAGDTFVIEGDSNLRLAIPGDWAWALLSEDAPALSLPSAGRIVRIRCSDAPGLSATGRRPYAVEHEHTSAPILGLKVRVRLHAVGLGIRAVAFEANGLGRPVDAVVLVLAYGGNRGDAQPQPDTDEH